MTAVRPIPAQEMNPGSTAARRPATWVSIPSDVRHWVPDNELAVFCLERAYRVEEQQMSPVFSLTEPRLFAPWSMLAVLTYAYSTGNFSSASIAKDLAEDDLLSTLAGRTSTDGRLLTRFRCRNAEVLEAALHDVLLWVAVRRGYASPSALNNPGAVPPLLRLQILCETRIRLNQAAKLDAAAGSLSETPKPRFSIIDDVKE